MCGVAVCSAVHYHGKYTNERERANTAENNLRLANNTITDMARRERDAAALDAKYTQELAIANAENDSLRQRLAAGGRVRVAGKCTTVPATAQTTSTPGVDTTTTVELSESAAENVLAIRAGIIRDQTALRALQEYVNTQCLN
ncbi:lysis protein [Enterobacteriaceae bacterium ESL0689]|nr:lysis protein [Enterobacteriaceae bacterium ESL0689]MDF7681203.1 lysis protein [Enterobacteriaceae bacterium ESL0689]